MIELTLWTYLINNNYNYFSSPQFDIGISLFLFFALHISCWIKPRYSRPSIRGRCTHGPSLH